jgi:hypothetical protein
MLDFMLPLLFVIFGIIFLVIGIIDDEFWMTVAGLIWIAGWGFRFVLSLMAFRANGLRPTERREL